MKPSSSFVSRCPRASSDRHDRRPLVRRRSLHPITGCAAGSTASRGRRRFWAVVRWCPILQRQQPVDDDDDDIDEDLEDEEGAEDGSDVKQDEPGDGRNGQSKP